MPLGPEVAKALKRRSIRDDRTFIEKYMSGFGLDIGYKGSLGDSAEPVANAIGVDLGYLGYDGIRLPFEDNSQDFVHASHVLEHIENTTKTLKEWYRVLKVGGYLIITVPHRDLYERQFKRPSRWNEDHKYFFTAGGLVVVVTGALEINSYRIRLLRECDDQHRYDQPLDEHPTGEYEIELVIEKLDTKNNTW